MDYTVDQRHFDPEIVRRVGRLDLVAEMIVNGLRQGMHHSRRRGFSTEFSDFNPYTPGDDLRFLDWRLFARTDRLFVKSFQAETNLEVLLLLDATRSMAWRWEDRVSKLEYAVNLLAALACLHMQQHDQVGLLLHDARELHHLPPRCRRSHLDAIFATLESVRPGSGDSFPELLEGLVGVRRHRGRLIVCSDLEEDEERVAGALGALTGHEDEIILLHLLDRAEVELPFDRATHLRDSETGELLQVNLQQLRTRHADQVQQFRELWRTRCTSAGIQYFPLDNGDDYADVIHRLLDEVKAGGRR